VRLSDLCCRSLVRPRPHTSHHRTAPGPPRSLTHSHHAPTQVAPEGYFKYRAGALTLADSVPFNLSRGLTLLAKWRFVSDPAAASTAAPTTLLDCRCGPGRESLILSRRPDTDSPLVLSLNRTEGAASQQVVLGGPCSDGPLRTLTLRLLPGGELEAAVDATAAAAGTVQLKPALLTNG
jgi:hypothetical protein